jgi:hypothetical protein
VISSDKTRSISTFLASFFSMVLMAACFFVSNMRVPAASSIMDRISMAFMLSTLVMRPCMMRKCGLFTLSCTEWKRFFTCSCCAVCPLIRYLFLPLMTTWRQMVISAYCSYPTGDVSASLLSNTMVTEAFVTPACPCLYTSSCRLPTRTCERFVIPRTKQIESRMFDFPDPFRPVIALNAGSNPETTVRVG